MDTEGYLGRASRRLDRFLSKYGEKSFRGCVHFFFWNLGQLGTFRLPMRPINDEVCRILFLLRGGMGDQMLALNYLQNLERRLDCRHEISVGAVHSRDLGMIRILCRDQDFIQKVHNAGESVRRADLVFEMVRFPRILYYNKEKIVRLSGSFGTVCDAMAAFQAKNPFLFRYSTPADALGIEYSRLLGRNRLRQGDIDDLLGVESLYRPKPILEARAVFTKFSLTRPFMTIQRGSGGKNRNISMKLWPTQNYHALVAGLRARFPNLAIVQLGMASNDAVMGVTHDLRGKTNLDEAMILLRDAVCHVDGEGGLVHLRHFLGGGPSVVLFGPTSAEFYGYSENVNISANLCPRGCEWLTGDYEKRCPRRFDGCQNSARIDNETVFQRTAEVLDERVS